MAATVFEISKIDFYVPQNLSFGLQIPYHTFEIRTCTCDQSILCKFASIDLKLLFLICLKLYRRFYHWWLQNDDGLSKAGWKITSSNRILIPLSRSHLSPSSLKTFAWYSLHIATRSSGWKKDSHWIQYNYTMCPRKTIPFITLSCGASLSSAV